MSEVEWRPGRRWLHREKSKKSVGCEKQISAQRAALEVWKAMLEKERRRSFLDRMYSYSVFCFCLSLCS